MSDIQFAKTIRIAVSDDVRLTKLETDIIDTPTFQRLRQVRQLGPSVWVYPTAVHTRFDHSLGVLHSVDQMVQAINSARTHTAADHTIGNLEISDNQRKLARLYALLHDVTHAPFGHTLEDELKIFGSHDAFQGASETSRRFSEPLGPMSIIGGLIIEHEGRDFYDRFQDIFLRGKIDRLEVVENGITTADEFIYYLVSDTVCADLLDYLQRDSFFCNLGLRAPTRLLNYLYVADIKVEGQTRRRVVLRLWKSRGGVHGDGKPRRDVLTDLTGLLDARYMVAERVYFHPAKLILGTMIGRSALEAKRAGLLDEISLMSFGDDTLLYYLRRAVAELPSDTDAESQASAALAAQLAEDVTNRRLYKRVARYHEEDFGEHADDSLPPKEVVHQNLALAEDRALQEDEIAEIAGLSPGDVLIYVGPKKMNMKIAEVIVDWRGSRKKLSELTQSDDRVTFDRLQAIQNSHLRLWVVDLMVRPSISEEQRRVIASIFEAKFLPKKDRRAKWVDVLTYLVEAEPLGNHVPADVTRACRAAAADLAEHEPAEVPAHGQTARERLVSLIKDKLTPNAG
ncbi:MAG: HD domain-containing protein [Sphingomonas sp.]